MSEKLITIENKKDHLSNEERDEGMYLAIAKGLTCNGVKDWQTVVLKSGKEMSIRFSGSMV
jgi:hypothetical protein